MTGMGISLSCKGIVYQLMPELILASMPET
jgi:hypothetical protein